MEHQKSFGNFVKDRFGPNWVYAHRATDALRARYDRNDCPVAVITPKEQKRLAADYKAQWGREHDSEQWTMICALRAIRAHAANRDNCPLTIEALAAGALRAAGVTL